MIETYGITIVHTDPKTRHRTPYFPGMPLDAAPQEVLDAVAGVWTDEAVTAWREANQSIPMVVQPTHGAAWAELIVSPLYQRALQLAFSSLPVNTAMTLFGMAYQAHQDLSHEVWASALSASAGHLAMAINASPFPLTTEEMAWVELWGETHHLGLTFDWSQANGE